MLMDSNAASDVGACVGAHTRRLAPVWRPLPRSPSPPPPPRLPLLSRGSPASIRGRSPGAVTVMDARSAAGLGPDDIVQFHFAVSPQVNWVKSIGA